MLYGSMTHLGLLAALGHNGRNGKILIIDGSYPVASGAPAAAEHIFLNPAPGLLDVTRILEALKRTVPIEKAGLMVPTADAMGIEAPEVVPARDEYRTALPGVTFNEISCWDFYDTAKAEDATAVIASADQRLYANLLLIIEVRAPDE